MGSLLVKHILFFHIQVLSQWWICHHAYHVFSTIVALPFLSLFDTVLICKRCRNFCESYDMKPHSTKIFRDIVNALGAFIQSQFMNQPGGPAAQSG